MTFDLLGEEVDFKPGQYFFVTLPDVGHQDEKGLRRHITVVTSPNEKGVLGLATRMRDSAFKRSLGELPLVPDETRKVDAQFVRDYLERDLNQYTFLVAGPPAMAEGVQKALEKAGVQEENVIAERYSGY